MVTMLKSITVFLTVGMIIFSILAAILKVYTSSSTEKKIETLKEKLSRTITYIIAIYLFIFVCIFEFYVLKDSSDIKKMILSSENFAERIHFSILLLILVIFFYWFVNNIFKKQYQPLVYIYKIINGSKKKIYIKRNLDYKLCSGYYFENQLKISIITSIENEPLLVETKDEVRRKRIINIGESIEEFKNNKITWIMIPFLMFAIVVYSLVLGAIIIIVAAVISIFIIRYLYVYNKLYKKLIN